MKTETYVCQACNTEVVRPVARGQRPKWCSECRAVSARGAKVCEQCGKTFLGSGKKFCSLTCRTPPSVPKPVKAKWDPRGELRRGYEDGDQELFFAALVAKADTVGECWIWPSLNKSGYPAVNWARHERALHRLVIEMKYGAPLGGQHAHHICATAACVNPEHLQPVTHRENIAEMLARQSYLARIRELEAALESLDHDHPLLAVLAVA